MTYIQELETVPDPPEGSREIGSRAFYVKKTGCTIVVRVHKIRNRRAVVIAGPESTTQTLHDCVSIKDAVMTTAWIFSLLRDFKLRTSRYNGTSGEAIFVK